MMFIGSNLKLTAYVVLVLMSINVTEINTECSGGFRGNMVEKIGKSPHITIHSIEVESSDQSKFQVLLTLRDPIIMNRRPGEQIMPNKTDVIVTCLRGWKEPDCQTCAHGWKKPACQACADNFGPPLECTSCQTGWAGENCDHCEDNFGPPALCNKCLKGWSGTDCESCATNFGPAGQCDQCLRGWDGNNCSKCATNFGPDGKCDTCTAGWSGSNCSECGQTWTGPNCSECATNFGPPGQCDQCLTGWTGENCSTCAPGWTGTECGVCERFGFCEESNCTMCIQNGFWRGKWNAFLMTAYLTFEGPACDNVVPGTIVHYSGYDVVVTGGNYDNTTNILRVIDTRRPTGHVNIFTKRISGTLGYNGASFWLNYQRSDNR